MQYQQSGGSWTARSEHSFWTQKAQGSTFTFDVTSDSHVGILLGDSGTWTQTLNRINNDHPDFLIDLGDTFGMDYYPDNGGVSTAAEADYVYLNQRQYFDLVSHSASIFLAAGNHEQQEGWHLVGDLATSLPVLGTNAQNKYYLNPAPDGFYTGDSSPYSYLSGDDLRRDYYAWEWGDALFVVINPYWYTTTKVFDGTTGGGETGDGSNDRWDWTLGQAQFNWLKTTVENSDAKYKFVFAHHMVGGSDDYVRGGANPAHMFEWGGYNLNGTTWGWDTERAGWGSEPIHQIFVNNNVSAFFHGHDHQYAYEERDGVVYQSLPSAGFSGSGFNIYTTGSGYTIQALPSPGHLRVTVGSAQSTVEYVSTTSGAVVANGTYTIAANAPTDAPVITSNGGGATAAVYAAENQTAVTDVNATDANGDTLTYSINGGADAAKFAIVPATGVLTFLSAPDFENPTDAGANNVYDVTVQVSDGALTDTQAIAVTVTDVADTTPPVLTFTSPSGLGSYTSAQTIPVGWSSSLDLDAGQFGVWARSAAGTWYVGQLAPTNAADNVLTYSANLALTGVPAGFYQVIVGYRPTVGSGAWTAFATSYGFVFEVGDAPTPAVTITQPTGQGSYTSAQSFTATWTASPSLTTGQFAVWVRSADGLTWYWKQPLIPATGAASYSTTVSLSGITPGLGYQVIVAYEPIANTSQWVSWATGPGVFSVDATAPTINISQPSGTTSYATTQSVTATWTTNQNLTGGQFGVWVRSGAGGYYVTTLVSATGTTGTVYSTALPLAGVPTGSNNQVIIAYRPVAGTGAFMSWATSPGSFTVN